MGKNLRYNKTAATSSPYDRLNWEYISGDTSSSQMGSLLISGSNGIAAWDFYAVPITTGAGVIPASFTRICRIATNGTDSTGGQIQMTSGADSAPSYSFTNDPDTGVYLPVSGSIGFATASTLRATIGSGQFSFGTDWVDNTSTGVDQFQIGNLSGDWGILGRVGSGNSFYITAADSNTTKLSRIKIGTTGNLEDNTANPALNWSSTALTVYKDIVMSGNETHDIGSTTNRVNDLWASYYYVKRENDHPVVQGIRDDSTITNVDHLLRLIAQGDLGSGAATSARIDMTADQTWVQGTARGARITFHTTANNTWASPPERMRIDHDGQVGIGETNPATLLHLSNSAGGNMLRLKDTGGAGNTANPYMDLRDSADLLLARFGNVVSTTQASGIATYNDFQFRIWASTGTATTSRFILDPQDATSARARFLNTQVYNDEGARITASGNVTLDWDEYNQVDITNDGTARIVTIDDNSMQDGGHYVLIIEYTSGGITSWTWSATGTLQWQGGSAPTLPNATAGDRTVITFVKTGGITLGFYADAPA
jgi:hypothetical protein